MYNAKESESHYEVIGEGKVYEFLPTGFEEMKYRSEELSQNGGRFTSSECILPNNPQPVKKPVKAYIKPTPRTHLLKFWISNKNGNECSPDNTNIPYISEDYFQPINSRLKTDPELSTNKPSPSLQYTPEPVVTNVRKVITKQLKPNVIPPMRRTISHSAVHSHKHTILAPEFQDMIPEPPKRDKSLRVKVTRQPIPSPVQPKEETKVKPNNEENYHTETNPTHQATQNYIQNNENTLPKIPPKTKSLRLRRSDSTPSKTRTTEQTNHNLKNRAKSIRRPPAVLVKPKLSRLTTKELIEEKSTAGERKERTIQDLESHLKEFKIIRSIESKSQLRMQNFYQESPSKVVN